MSFALKEKLCTGGMQLSFIYPKVSREMYAPPTLHAMVLCGGGSMELWREIIQILIMPEQV